MPESYIEPLTDRQVCFKCHKSVTGKKKLSKCSRCHAITYCGPQCQKADWDRHSWNCLPVMVTEFEGKGRGLVAAKDIKMGDLIFTDKPMIKLAAVPGGCLPDSTAMDSMMTQIGNLSSEAKKQFYKLKPPLESDLEFAFRYLNLPEYGRDEYMCPYWPILFSLLEPVSGQSFMFSKCCSSSFLASQTARDEDKV